MKTLADFKRRLVVVVKLHAVRHTENDRDLGIREVSVVQSRSFALSTTKTTGESTDSWCDFPIASQCTFTEDSMTIWFSPPGKELVRLLTYSFI